MNAAITIHKNTHTNNSIGEVRMIYRYSVSATQYGGEHTIGTITKDQAEYWLDRDDDELKPADQYSQTFTISSISNSSEWILPSHPSGKLVSGSSPFSYLFKMIFSTSSGDRDSIIISSVTTSVRPSSWTKVIWYFTLYSVCQLFITKCPCKFLCASPSGVEQQTHTHVTF